MAIDYATTNVALSDFERSILRRIALGDQLMSLPGGWFELRISHRRIPPKTGRKLLRYGLVHTPFVPMFPSPEDGGITPVGRCVLDGARP
jgi:hypothetical protein